MTSKETYTKIFLQQAGIGVSDVSVKEYTHRWWQNTRTKNSGGLRLTEEGIDFLSDELELATYDIPFPRDLKITTNILIWLDNFIDCPYFLGTHGLTVTNEKKALELHLFSGDIKKYGLTKAMKRQN